MGMPTCPQQLKFISINCNRRAATVDEIADILTTASRIRQGWHVVAMLECDGLCNALTQSFQLPEFHCSIHRSQIDGGLGIRLVVSDERGACMILEPYIDSRTVYFGLKVEDLQEESEIGYPSAADPSFSQPSSFRPHLKSSSSDDSPRQQHGAQIDSEPEFNSGDSFNSIFNSYKHATVKNSPSSF